MKFLKIAFYDLKKLYRDRAALVMVLFMPILFSVIMGMVFDNADTSINKIPIGLTNNDNSKFTNTLITELSKDPTIKIDLMSENDILNKIKSSDIEIGVVIPSNFGTNASNNSENTILIHQLPSSLNAPIIKNMINAKYSQIILKDVIKDFVVSKIPSQNTPQMLEFKTKLENDLETNYTKNLSNPVVSTLNTWFSNDEKTVKYNGKANAAIGYMIMFVMFTLVLGAGEILEEKKVNTWSRLLISPISKFEILSGKITGTFLRGWSQIIILILFGNFIIGIKWGNSLPATLILLSAFLFAVTGIGLILTNLVNTNSQLGAFSSIIIVPTTALSGCWWPLEIEPVFMQKIAVIFPQYWAMKGLTNTVVGNLGINSILYPSSILALMGILFFFIAFILVKVKKSLW